MRTPRRNDDPPDHDAFCDMCGNECGSCICPECPDCDVAGDPACYREHGLVETQEQRDSRKQNLEAAEGFARWERDHPFEVPDEESY